MLQSRFLVAACVLALTVGAADATTFNVTGSIGNPADGHLIVGTVDITGGTTAAADLSVTNLPANYTSIVTSQASAADAPAEWEILVADLTLVGQTLDVYFLTPTAGTLAGFNGAQIVKACIAGSSLPVNDCAPIVEGSLTPAATPLPAGLPLFASGLGAMGLLGWRKKKKTAARVA